MEKTTSTHMNYLVSGGSSVSAAYYLDLTFTEETPGNAKATGMGVILDLTGNHEPVRTFFTDNSGQAPDREPNTFYLIGTAHPGSVDPMNPPMCGLVIQFGDVYRAYGTANYSYTDEPGGRDHNHRVTDATIVRLQYM